MEKNLASKIVMSFNALLIIHQNMYVENKSKNFNKLFDAFLDESVELIRELRLHKNNLTNKNVCKKILSNYFQCAIEKGKPITEIQLIANIAMSFLWFNRQNFLKNKRRF